MLTYDVLNSLNKNGVPSIAVSRFTPGPMWDLGHHFQSLLTAYNQPQLMARRWSGQWDPEAIASLQPIIAPC